MVEKALNYYHYEVGNITRGNGDFVSRAVAYIRGEKINDHYYGMTHDFSFREDVLHKEVLLPEGTPANFSDAEALVNAIEEAEHRKDSRTAKQVTIALSNNKGCTKEQEFTMEEYANLVRCYVREAFVSHGRCAIIAIHEGKNENDPTKNNPHAHVILTDRPVDKNGFCLKKNRVWNKNYVRTWRELWADMQNREFERKGLSKFKVSAKNYIMLGINREPAKHLGSAVIALEKRGIKTDRSIKHEQITTRNLALDKKKQFQKEREKSRERDREISR